ncbi:hypothetical protein SAMN02745133_01560 [Desulforamulus putei DSM 12395]|uniref:Uncharacterized protein n=1 Tax=Desulforamulus putei DSM 12395 TaxID=1121429 RepID=A0A1M4XX10_9FIRM|nr:hypothetical protein SAMN02745133_01560 [Desulforamulus putei DSM 12395]
MSCRFFCVSRKKNTDAVPECKGFVLSWFRNVIHMHLCNVFKIGTCLLFNIRRILQRGKTKFAKNFDNYI